MAQKKATSKRAAAKKQARKKASKYIAEEMREYKKGKLDSPQQAIAIGLSKARREGEALPPPKKGTASAAKKRR